MKDITWCVSSDCPDMCERHVLNCREKGMVSLADFSGVCRRYIGCVLEEVEKREARTGTWIDVDGCMAYCSECYGLGCGSKYCPNCGAKMNVEDSYE